MKMLRSAFCAFALVLLAPPPPASADSAVTRVAFEGVVLQAPVGWRQERNGTILVLTAPTDKAQIVILPYARVNGSVRAWVDAQARQIAAHHGAIVRTSWDAGSTENTASVTFVVQDARGQRIWLAVLAGRSANGQVVATCYLADDAQSYQTYIPTVEALDSSIVVVPETPKKPTFWQSFISGMRAAAIARQQTIAAPGGTSSFTGLWRCINFQISGGNGVCPAGNVMDIRSDETYVFHGLVGRYHLSGNTIFFDSGGYASFGSGVLGSNGLIKIDVHEDGTEMIYYFER